MMTALKEGKAAPDKEEKATNTYAAESE